MKDLRQIWEIGGFVHDQNGDGVPDGINVSIELSDDCLPIALIDFCGRLGFETTALSYQFFQNQHAEWSLRFLLSQEETACELVLDRKEVLLHYKSIDQLNTLLYYLSANWPQNLETIKSPVRKLILKGEHFYAYSLEEVVECTAHLRPTTHSVQFNKINSLADFWNGTGFCMNGEPSPKKEVAYQFNFKSLPTSPLLKECCFLAARIGMVSTMLHFPITCKDIVQPFVFSIHDNEVDEAFVELNETGDEILWSGNAEALCRMVRYFATTKHFSEGGEFGIWESLKSVKSEDIPLFQLEWNEVSERERAKSYVKEILSGYTVCSNLSVELFISEPSKIRKEIKQQLLTQFGLKKVEVYSAFKPAYSWIEEEVIPILEHLEQQVCSIKIECQKEMQEDGLELPIRWIQELYPIDLLLEKRLGISKDSVEFSLKEDDSDPTITLNAIDKEGKLVHRSSLTIPVSKVPYIEKGKYAYPTTGKVLISDGENLHHEKLIPTDRELFYIFYQEEVLPLLWEKVKDRDNGQGITKPLFDRIEIYASMSEEERRLDLDEERISSMEALHEDIYFNTLEYFIEKGEKEVGKRFTAPGGVYPFVNAVEGINPKAQIKAYQWQENEQRFWMTKKLIFDKNQVPVKAFMVDSKTKTETINDLSLYPNQEETNFLDKWGLDTAFVHQWIPANSYRGEEIPVLEVFDKTNEQFFSPLKLTSYKPTIFIEAGHHANEVSSTPAILELIRDLSTTMRHLLKEFNLVVIPLANPDGARLHEKMANDNPEWKHHAARYNGVGLEYTHARYKQTVFGEADVVPKIMKKWAPDIVVDDHGIPSHEWVQPFAGYNSPSWFPVSYWIPNALIYGIGWETDYEQYPIQAKNLSVIADNIRKKVEESDIYQYNMYWKERYEKYGNRWLPEIFPLEQTNGFIFYKRAAKTNPDSPVSIERYPDWVCADIISEAADETVYGEALDRCLFAHKVFDLAILETVANKKQVSEKVNQPFVFERKRERPMSL